MELHDEAGLIGKALVIWLILLALLVIAVIDAGSIVFANIQVSDAAQTAASTAANTYRETRDVEVSCKAAKDTVPEDEDIDFPKAFCEIDTGSGEATVKLRRDVDTLVAGRLGFTKDLTVVEISETGRPSAL
jgi:Flp pilus assembly protein TadG